MRRKIRVVPLGTVDEFRQALTNAGVEITLGAFLAAHPARSVDPIDPDWMGRPLGELRLIDVEVSDNVALHDPPGLDFGTTAEQPAADAELANDTPAEQRRPPPGARLDAETETASPSPLPAGHISERDAVLIAYSREIEDLASFLRAGEGLSVLVYCDKMLVEHLWPAVVRKAGREARLPVLGDEGGGGLVPQSLQQRQLAALKREIGALKDGQVLVIQHLDLLAGGADGNLGNEARELTELVYGHPDRLILAFADRSLTIPEVLGARFAVRREISGVSRSVIDLDGTERLLGEIFVTAEDAGRFEHFQPADLYKNVAGMNPIQILHAVHYAVLATAGKGPQPPEKLYRSIRAFKVQSSASFEVPDVGFEHIGGYDELQAQLTKAINTMLGAYNLPERMRSELIPKGFIFYGPPGTGKTLFAKAIANKLNATVQVVSGPEVMDMYVGESERKLREIFAEARRNAPSVLVFDEFDAIAAKRSGREDGGSRAGNAVVAQMLTEMDGFRPDVPMLVIGTTNRVELIDEALLRPSRFQAINIPLPDKRARRAIAEVHADWFELRDQVSDGLLEVIAEATDLFNGDEIRSLFRDARLGLHCDDQPVTAERFGELVGAIRHDVEQRQVSASAQEGGPSARRPGTRRSGQGRGVGTESNGGEDEPMTPL